MRTRAPILISYQSREEILHLSWMPTTVHQQTKTSLRATRTTSLLPPAHTPHASYTTLLPRSQQPPSLFLYCVGKMARTAFVALACGMLSAASALTVVTPEEGQVVIADR